jgi:hypothetical protein
MNSLLCYDMHDNHCNIAHEFGSKPEGPKTWWKKAL